MTDTAQALAPADPGVVSDLSDPRGINAAAEMFKQAIDPRPRDEAGRFAPKEAPPEEQEEIEAEEGAEEVADAAESDGEQEGVEEAADEAQPDPVEMPSSWAKEDAEMWSALPAAAQEKIRSREAERDAAVNLKFQEAANVRKANEALIEEARTNRERFIQEADFVLSLVQLQEPPVAMLDRNSPAYNPDKYHLLKAEYESAQRTVEDLRAKREDALARAQEDEDAAFAQSFAQVEEKTRPELLKAFPDIADQAKAPAALREIVEYAVRSGIPQELFTDPALRQRISSAELLLAGKAMLYDRIQAAKGKVEVKGAQAPSPSLRAGAQPTKSAIKHRQQAKAMERLESEGTVDAAAAFFKNIM